MFRPLGQQAFSRAVRIMMDRSWSMNDSIRALAQVPMALDAPPWKNIVWDPHKQSIIRNFGKQYLEGILLYMVGEVPQKPKLKLLEKYRNYLRDERAMLPDPVAGTLI